MAEFGRMSHYDFTTSNEAQRTSYIKKWAIGELGKDAGTEKFNYMMGSVRIGHEGKHYDESKPVVARNFDELSDVLFSDEAQDDPYKMTDSEISQVVPRAVREVQTVSTFIDAGRATYAIISGIHDSAVDVGNWITFGKNKSAELNVDFDGVFCGSGMLNRPQGYVMGQMFPEMSTQMARVVLQKDKLSQHFFRVQTAFPDLAADRQPTGRFLDNEIEKALKNPELSEVVKGYWQLSLCGYTVEINPDKDQMRCSFEFEGKQYRVLMNENSWMYPSPYLQVQQEDGRWGKPEHCPSEVIKEADKIHGIISLDKRELTNIRDGILRTDEELDRSTQNREDIEQE